MTPEQKENLKAATPKLKILDVVLVRSAFTRATEEPTAPGKAWQQHKRGVQYGITDSSEGNARELHVLVQLGTRVLLSEAAEGLEGVVQFEIEADFVVRYQIAGGLDESALDVFANFNSVHNVWPFWRQHVYDIVQRARLPHLEIPLFSGSKS
ncbi:hypothetical protein [Denitratimonas tolerans]|uniref:Preprotein translocase subunit SecB n=1 Tax=Denitratimonas tolerans TaxID=1338420 RepID=A0AAW9R4T8_9GAMM